MEIRTLYSFLCAAREGNITKAAEKLHLSQPALSRQLAALEDEVGTLLLIRGKRHLQLTEAGMLLRRRAEEILALVDKTEKELLDQSESLSGTLSIGAAECEAARVLLPQLVKRFHQLHPQVTYAFTSGTADLIRDRIDSGLLDFGILMEPVDLERYDFVRLPFFEEWGALVSVHAPLAQKESLRPRDLESIPLIYSGRTIVQNEINSWLQDSADRLTILATYDLISNAVSFAADVWERSSSAEVPMALIRMNGCASSRLRPRCAPAPSSYGRSISCSHRCSIAFWNRCTITWTHDEP